MIEFFKFCEVCERVSKTTKKLEKIACLSSFLSQLNDKELEVTSRLLSTRIFPPTSGLQLDVGYSILVRAIKEVSGKGDDELSNSYLKHGDLGKVAEELLQNKALSPLFAQQLTITSFYNYLKKIAKAKGEGSVDEKKRLIVGLLTQATSLEAKYIVKILTGEMRIGVVEGLVEESIARAFHVSLEKVRRGVLVSGDFGKVAVMAKNGKLDRLDIEPFSPIQFMLAETMQTPEEIYSYFKKRLVAEYKFDGVRVQVHKKGRKVLIFSRRLDDITNSFPEVVKSLLSIPNDFIVDGEVVAIKGNKPLSFNLLQQRLRRKNVNKKIIEEIPVTLFCYDILYLDGNSTIDLNYLERRKRLESLNFTNSAKLSPIYEVSSVEDIAKLFRISRELGYEGLMVKDPESVYSPGKRGKHWVKLKEELDTLDVVIVAAEHGHGKRAGLLSDYTFAVKDNDNLRVIGKAYSGLTDDEILMMTERLKQLMIKDEGFRIVVKPEIVLEVAFDSIQRSNRHDSGFALRFPRIKRIRDDKSIDDIDTLERVKMIYERQKVKR
jgi:DNA ligase-1